MDSFVQTFNMLKTIHCMCPHCDSLMRVSDLQLRSKEKTEKTWLDIYDAKTKTIEKKEDAFSKEESEIRAKSVERGRRQVPKIINKSINNEFLKLKYDPYDVKAILHPIDFVAFEGMNQGDVKNVTLLSNKNVNPQLQSIQRAIQEAINNKSYDWKVLHVSSDGEVTYK